MRRKNIVESLVLLVFMLCIAFIIIVSVEYISMHDTMRYLTMGQTLLTMTMVITLIFLAIRLVYRLSRGASGRAKDIAVFAVMLQIALIGIVARTYVIAKFPADMSAASASISFRLGADLARDTLLTVDSQYFCRYAVLFPQTMTYPMLLLNPVFRLFGVSVNSALYANLFISILIIIAGAYLGKRIAGRFGMLTMVTLISLWPGYIFSANVVSAEPLYTLLILLAAILVNAIFDRSDKSLYAQNPRRAVSCMFLLGIVFGLAYSVRTETVFFVLAYAIMQFTVKADPTLRFPVEGVRLILVRSWFSVVIVIIVLMMTCVCVNSVRRDMTMETSASGLSANGYRLMSGMSLTGSGQINEEDEAFLQEQYAETGSAAKAADACLQEAILRMRQTPFDILNLMIEKFVSVWESDEVFEDHFVWAQDSAAIDHIQSLLTGMRSLGRIMYLCMFLFALIAALRAFTSARAPLPILMTLVLAILGYSLGFMLFESKPEYHYGVLPLIMLLASATVFQWREQLQEEPPVKLIVRDIQPEQPKIAMNTFIDLEQEIDNGHITVTASKAYTNSDKELPKGVQTVSNEAQTSRHLAMDETEAPTESAQVAVGKTAKEKTNMPPTQRS